MRSRRFNHVLSGSMDARREREADIHFRRYTQPWGTRLDKVKHECNEETKIVGGRGYTYAPGSVVMTGSHSGRPGGFGGQSGEAILTDPPPGKKGGAYFPVVFPPAQSLATVEIVSASPNTIDAGTSNLAVALTTIGFRTTDEVEAVTWDETTGEWITDTLITVHNITVNSATSVDIQVDADATCPDGYAINLRAVR